MILVEKLPLSVFKLVILVENLALAAAFTLADISFFVNLVEKLPESVFHADILDVIAVILPCKDDEKTSTSGTDIPATLRLPKEPVEDIELLMLPVAVIFCMEVMLSSAPKETSS